MKNTYGPKMGRALKEVPLVRLPHSIAGETESWREKMTKRKSMA